jgi:hypothetical protein
MSSLLNITGLYEPQEVAMNLSEINSNLIYFKIDTEGNFDSVNSDITDLTTDLNEFKMTTNYNIDSVNSDITDLTTDLNEFKLRTNYNIDSVNSSMTYLKTASINFETQANDTFISINNSLIDLSNDIISLDQSTSNNFELTNDYIDAKHQEGKDYTDTEVENLRNEGLIQEAITQVLAWITSDEGKRFRKKIWDKIRNKWATFTGSRPYTELLDDVQQASADILDDLMKVYRYDLNNAGIRTDPFLGKDIVMKGDTYIYDGNLHLTGDIYKGTFNSASGSWTQNKKLNDYLVLKGVKTNHCLEINTTTELLELLYDNLDFELGPAPTYKLKLKYPIHSVHPTQCISVNETTKQLEFNVNTDYFEFETNTKKTLKPKFLCTGIDTGTPLSLNSSKLKLDYDTEYFSVDAANKLSPLFQAKGITSGSGLSIDATTKLLKFTPNSSQFWTNQNLLIRFNANGGIVDNTTGIGIGLQIKLADTSLSLSSSGLKLNIGQGLMTSVNGVAIKYNDTLQVNASQELCTTFDCKGINANNGLSIDSVTKLLNYNLNPDYFNINATNQLSPVFEFKGLKTTSNPLKIDTTTKLLEFGYNTSVFWIDSSSRLRIRYITDGGFVKIQEEWELN